MSVTIFNGLAKGEEGRTMSKAEQGSEDDGGSAEEPQKNHRTRRGDRRQ
jgi:hypothetical protein